MKLLLGLKLKYSVHRLWNILRNIFKICDNKSAIWKYLSYLRFTTQSVTVIVSQRCVVLTNYFLFPLGQFGSVSLTSSISLLTTYFILFNYTM